MRKQILSFARIYVLALIITSVAAAKASQPLTPIDICNSPTVHLLPQKDPAYVVKYQILEGTRSDLPVLLYLQGGPGGTAILPDNTPRHAWTEIRMDMPGTGCSKILTAPSLDQLDLSTDRFVTLWIQLINDLNLKRVVLQGRSYGTQIATQLAFQIEATKKPVLESVILEGTTGPAGKSAQWADGYLIGWKRLRDENPILLSSQNVDQDKPFGIDQDEWTSFVIYSLTWNMFPNNGTFTHNSDMLKILVDPKASNEEKQSVLNFIHQVNLNMHALIDSYLYQRLSCEESNPSGIEYNLRWNRGQLAYPTVGFCADKPWKLIRPYDSKNYPYRAPTFYIEGGQDPNTPFGGKLYHIS